MSKRRVTLGPLTMSNVNSRASLGGGLLPQDANRRKSTISSSASRLPDPRNITDKAVMNSGVRKLSEYLIAHGFEGAVSPRILISPSTKDFFNIVEFLLRQLDPNIKITGRLEDEFITMFKYFGYPFNIAKSSISAVGSPHAWPTLLACLTWLLEILQYHQLSIEAEQHEETDADPAASEKGFYAYLARAYSMFINCKDELYEQLQEQLIKSFEDKDILVQDQVEALVTRNGAIAAEIEQIKNRSSYLPELVAKKKEFQLAHSQFAALVEDLQQVRKQIFDKVEQRKFELSSVNNGIAALEEKLATMRNTIQTQELSPEDVLNLVTERKRLEDANAAIIEVRQGVQRQIIELEANLRSRVVVLEEAVKLYHTYAEGLKLVPVSARNARGLDLSIEVDIRAKKKEGLLKTEVRNHVLPALQQMKAELTQTTYELRNERMREEEETSEIEAQKSAFLDTIAEMEAKQRRAEVSYKRERELLDQSAAIQTTEIDGMEARLMQLRDTAMAEATLTAAKRRIAEITAMRAARKAEHERKVAAMKASIMETVSMCADHREMVQATLEDLKAQYTHRLQVVLNPEPMDGGECYMGDSILSEGLEY